MGLYGRVGLLVLFSVFLLHACGTGVEMYHKFGPEHVAVDGKGGMGLELQSSCPSWKEGTQPHFVARTLLSDSQADGLFEKDVVGVLHRYMETS